MSKKSKKSAPKKEIPKNAEQEVNDAPLAEVLVATALQLGQQRNLNLAEVIGHMTIGTIEAYSRQIRSWAEAQQASAAAAQKDAPAEGGDNESSEASSQDEDEDTSET